MQSRLGRARANWWNVTERAPEVSYLGTKTTPDGLMVLAIYYASAGDVVLRFHRTPTL